MRTIISRTLSSIEVPPDLGTVALLVLLPTAAWAGVVPSHLLLRRDRRGPLRLVFLLGRRSERRYRRVRLLRPRRARRRRDGTRPARTRAHARQLAHRRSPGRSVRRWDQGRPEQHPDRLLPDGARELVEHV